jgi:hypothetical protein
MATNSALLVAALENDYNEEEGLMEFSESIFIIGWLVDTLETLQESSYQQP